MSAMRSHKTSSLPLMVIENHFNSNFITFSNSCPLLSPSTLSQSNILSASMAIFYWLEGREWWCHGGTNDSIKEMESLLFTELLGFGWIQFTFGFVVLNSIWIISMSLKLFSPSVWCEMWIIEWAFNDECVIKNQWIIVLISMAFYYGCDTRMYFRTSLAYLLWFVASPLKLSLKRIL